MWKVSVRGHNGVEKMCNRHYTHPNAIVFFTDQERGDTSGLHGNPLDLEAVPKWRGKDQGSITGPRTAQVWLLCSCLSPPVT